MASEQQPNLGLWSGFSSGDSGWGDRVNANFVRLDRLVQFAAISATTTDPPSNPADGDRYIIPANATGAWQGEDHNVGVWDEALSAWEIYEPDGWIVVAKDTAKLLFFDGSTWVDASVVQSKLVNLADVDDSDLADGRVPVWDSNAGDFIFQDKSSGGGISGPGSSTDNALPRYDGTSGNTVQNSGVTVDDNDNISGMGQVVQTEGSDFTLDAARNGKTLEVATGSAATVTVPANNNVSLPVGYTISVVQADGNAVTFSGESTRDTDLPMISREL